MSVKTDEISQIIKQQLENYQSDVQIDETGTINFVGDGIVRVSGLSKVMSGELLDLGNDIYGMATNVEVTEIGVVVLGKYEKLEEGMVVKRTKRVMEVPVGDEFIGRVVNSLGQPIDGLGKINSTKTRLVENSAPGIMERQPVNEPLQTGIKAIDALVPIGKGQRELIIGDRKTGKTSLAVDTVLNQKGKNVKVVYVSIGQKDSTVRNQVETFKKYGAMDYTVVVSAGPSESASMLYLAPFVGTAIGEEFMYNKQDVLVVFDDLSKQAVSYREMSLILRRPPGREAYPGDVFYLHSRLLERSARLNDELGGGSMTALPFIETQAGDVSAYIPTNVISITDGQIFLDSDEFYAGVRPAVDAGTSVSRVGGDAQIKAMKKVAGSLRLDLASFRELEAFSQFGSDLDQATQNKLDRGRRTVEVLKQPLHKPMEVSHQVVIFYSLTRGYLDSIKIQDILRFQDELIDYIENSSEYKSIFAEISQTGNLGNEQTINDAITSFKSIFDPSV